MFVLQGFNVWSLSQYCTRDLVDTLKYVAPVARGWQNVEFTYTVAKKFKAQVLNPPPPSYPPKLGMFFPPSHVFLGRNHSAITNHQPDNIFEYNGSNLSQNLLMTAMITMNNNYTVVTQWVTGVPK